MTPWRYTRYMILAAGVGWLTLLTGRIVEAGMGERQLMTTPGAPPWTRRGQWYGWEFGPITSKHYAHVTPQRGHYSWQVGWGPQGQQELWPSDLFGFHPESDMHWVEEGVEGAPFHGENEWAKYRLNYGTQARMHSAVAHEDTWEPHSALPMVASMSDKDAGAPAHGDASAHGGASHGASPAHGGAAHEGHRRLRGEENSFISSPAMRPLVPAAVQWPALLEPDLLACGPAAGFGGPVAVLTGTGYGAIVPPAVAAGEAAGPSATFSLEGLPAGTLRGAAWSGEHLEVVGAEGHLVRCAAPARTAEPTAPTATRSAWPCRVLSAPAVPGPVGRPATTLQASMDGALRAAIAVSSGEVSILELVADALEQTWREAAVLPLPPRMGDERPEVVAITSTAGHLIVTVADGTVHRWDLGNLQRLPDDTPATSAGRLFRSACALPTGGLVRLSATWRKEISGATSQRPELLL
eukprot:TRINITY_DN14119_c0_g1_i2.p1 TRINITY_DN14119_c0_g1~~TRINITY_DN14119_c0_g1_i2.p1  ORF type:complete len:467 (-),score=58.92 TRINITY_DN14119_c0_g1_i2:192-1592(-)